MVGCWVAACSGVVVESHEGSGGAAGSGGLEQGQAGAGQGGEGLAIPMQGGAPSEGGASAVGGAGDAGAGGESFAGAGGVDPGGGWAGVPEPTSIWDCEHPVDHEGSGDGDAGASGAGAVEQIGPPTAVPTGGEATLAQLVGLWAHDTVGPGEFWGLSDDFVFNADGTGSQGSGFWSDLSSDSTTYAGTFELANHVITLDSTAGTQTYSSYNHWGPIPGTYKYEKLPHQIIHYGYSYDAPSDTLYVNTARCSDPLPFKRH